MLRNEDEEALGDKFMVGTDQVDVFTHRITPPEGDSFELSFEAMQLLVVLAARAGQVVTTETLLEAIWGSTPETIERDREEISYQFGDLDPEQPRYIEVIPGVGYRLLQTVRPGAVPFNARHSRMFLLELNRRKVFRVAAWYCIVAFILLQISDATFDGLGMPGDAVPLMLVILVIGFPIVVLLAWFLELTARGIERDAQSGWFRRMGRRWEAAAGLGPCSPCRALSQSSSCAPWTGPSRNLSRTSASRCCAFRTSQAMNPTITRLGR